MKNSLLFAGLAAVATLSFVGCNKEADVPGTGRKTAEIRLSAEDTRTINDGMSTLWAEDDALTVFYAPAGTTEYSANTKFSITDADSGLAKGDVELTADANDWYLFYPYTSQIPDPTGLNEAGELTGYFYVGSSANGSQTQEGLNSMAHIAGSRLPMVGQALDVPAEETPAVSMKHLATVLKINVNNVYEDAVTFTKVSFTAPVDIVGSAYIDFSGSEPVLTPSEGHVGKTAKLTVQGADPLESGETAAFYLAVMPFSISSGDLLTIEMVAAEGTCTAQVEVSKDYDFEAGKIKTLNVDFEVEAPIETTTVTDAIAAADNSAVTITGAIVAARSTKGFIATDGTSNVYVFMSKTPDVAVGDEVTVSGTKTTYYDLPEITDATVTAVSHDNDIPRTTLVELDGDNIDDYDCTAAADFISVTGKLEKSSSYFSVRPEGSTRYARTDYMDATIVEDPSAYVGKTVTMKGYFNTLHSTNNYLKVVVTEFTSDETPAAALESIEVSGQMTEFTVGDVFNFGGTVTAIYEDETTKDVTESATFSGYDMSTAGEQTVTVSYTEGEVTKTTTYDITVSAPEGNVLTITMTEYVDEHECTVSSGGNEVMYTMLQLNESVRMSTTGKPNCGSFWNTSSSNTTKQWRLYQNKAGDLTISVAEGCELKSVKVTYSPSGNGVLIDSNDEQVSSGTVCDASGSSITFTVGNTEEDGKNGQVRVTAVEVVYTGDGTTFPDEPGPGNTEIQTTITLVGSASVYVGETVSLNASSNVPEATITYESEDESIATVDEDGVVTGVADGVVKVYARIAGVEGEYTSAERYCNVTVSTKPEPVEGTVVFDQNYLKANKDGSKDGISYTNSTTYSGDVTELRVYKNATFVISAEEGKTITSITMTCTAKGTAKYGPGSWGDGAPDGYTFETDGFDGTWTGSASSVTFTATDNQVRITNLVVTYE